MCGVWPKHDPRARLHPSLGSGGDEGEEHVRHDKQAADGQQCCHARRPQIMPGLERVIGRLGEPLQSILSPLPCQPCAQQKDAQQLFLQLHTSRRVSARSKMAAYHARKRSRELPILGGIAVRSDYIEHASGRTFTNAGTRRASSRRDQLQPDHITATAIASPVATSRRSTEANGIVGRLR